MGELHYRSDFGVLKSVTKRGKSLQNVSPAVIVAGGITVNPRELRDVEKLLEKHFAADWKSIRSLALYKNVLQLGGNKDAEGSANEECCATIVENADTV